MYIYKITKLTKTKIRMKKIVILFIMTLFCFTIEAQVSFTKSQEINLGTNLWKVMVDTADMNNDGQLEAVTMYLTAGDSMNVGIYKINADSTQTTTTTFVIKTGVNINWAMRNFIILDANIQTDDRKDIAYVHTDSVTILFQKVNGTFGLDSSVTMLSGATADGIAKGDFNKDGREDFVTCNWNDDNLTIFVQSLGCFYGYDFVTAVQAGYNQIKVADVNEDGWQDIIFLAGQGMSSGVYVYFNDNGWFTTDPPTYMYLTSPITGNTTITQSVSFGNFFGSGKRLLLNTNSSYTTPNSEVFTPAGLDEQTLSLPDFGPATTIGDFNGDGRDELAVLNNYNTQTMMVIEFTPSISINAFPQQMNGNFHSLDQAIICGDVLGNDGKLDIITVTDYGVLTIWENTFITTQVKESQEKVSNDISISPNPTSDYINIRGNQEKYHVVITNVAGQVVVEQYVSKQIDVSKFPKGMYCAKIGTTTKKFIVQ